MESFENKQLRSVKFRENPRVRRMFAWSYAYRAARCGEWETVARDRVRFSDRIKKIGEILEPVLLEKISRKK